MPKMKTRRAVVAKFKVTATGKLLRRRQGKRHLATMKTTKRKRKLRAPGLVSKSFEPLYKRMMCC